MFGSTLGSYLVEAKIGQGGMGAVYKARHVQLGRQAAVKVLLPQYSANPDIVQRFFNEAKAATSIHHLGIVEVYDFGTMPDGVAYIVMELLHGESLASRMRQGLTPRAALGFLRLMCGALGAAHERGIVHRDLKPDNVFIIADAEVAGGERVKLLDFGIAKLTQGDGEMTSHKTRTGSLIGTPAYMSPEQCRGVTVDFRADIYSLGCMLYEMVTGRPPFEGEGVGDILGAHMYHAPVPVTSVVPSIAPAVSQLVTRMLAKQVESRPQSAAAVIAEIDVILAAGVDSLPVASGAKSMALANTLSAVMARRTPEPSSSTRGRKLVWAAGVGALAVVGAVAIVNRHEDPVPAAIVSIADASPAPPPDAPSAMPPVDAVTATSIHVVLDTTPHGAHVMLDGNELGITPYTGTLPRDHRALAFILRRPGYKDVRVDASSDDDITRLVKLAARGVAPAVGSAGTQIGSGAPPKSNANRHIGSDEEVNPFRH